MAITLEQARLNTSDALQVGVIDEFRKSSFIINNMIFDDCISPLSGGTLTYSYNRLRTESIADFRSINSEYTSNEAEKQRITTDLAVFGGSFKMDRVINSLNGAVDEVSLQIAQKIKASIALFNDTVINGDISKNNKGFDGLEKAVTGSSTEYVPDIIDLSTSDAVDSNYKIFLDELDEFLMGISDTPSFIAGNTKLIAKIRACGRRAGTYTVSTDTFGRNVDAYNGIPLIDLGSKTGTNEPVSAIDDDGLTSIYVSKLALDGFHGVSLMGQSPVNIWLPDYNSSGAVKTGEVEMVLGVALKSTKSAGIMRNIKVK